MNDTLSALTGETNSEILSTFLKIAADKVLRRAYPFDDSVTEVPKKYESVQLQIAAYLLNKRGAEGELTHAENGISRSYENGDVPASLLRDIVPCAAPIGGVGT